MTTISRLNAPRNRARAVLAAAGLATLLTGVVTAQQRRGSADDWCRDENRGRNSGDDRQSVCEVREYSVPAAGATMTVDAKPNGGIDVEGSARGDILVRAKIVATADTEEEARALAARVQVVATADRVSADGPRGSGGREGWSVSYRLAVPTPTPLSLKSTNGGISIDNVNSRVEFTTTNGGVTLSRIGGDVEGRTTNGGINVDLDGNTWQGGGLDVQTTNGGVHLTLPEHYSAHLETGTTNGSVKIDFPVMVQGRIGRSLSTDLGSGGPTLRVTTSNGGVKISKK